MVIAINMITNSPS
ncbi:hypothetical protein F383_38936 [Gossypium arboreum]|uniref:Uncharacterized protein n=1 Tax=Gossypium arboreum TaxID=29729 RepID=A0A0B0MIK5_GOSAR|nr:hypothetical protein F383_38936 [Gossypium arboreum]